VNANDHVNKMLQKVRTSYAHYFIRCLVGLVNILVLSMLVKYQSSLFMAWIMSVLRGARCGANKWMLYNWFSVISD